MTVVAFAMNQICPEVADAEATTLDAEAFCRDQGVLLADHFITNLSSSCLESGLTLRDLGGKVTEAFLTELRRTASARGITFASDSLHEAKDKLSMTTGNKQTAKATQGTEGNGAFANVQRRDGSNSHEFLTADAINSTNIDSGEDNETSVRGCDLSAKHLASADIVNCSHRDQI